MLIKIRKIIDAIKNRLLHYRKDDHLKVIITGPPRSGTSFLAGLVVRMGYSPGPTSKLRKADKDNPYGFYENMPLMEIDHNLLKKFGGSVIDPPDLPGNWIGQCEEEKRRILKIVRDFGIEVYKGNMLVILADLYAELFPGVKWIMIHRGEKETIRSIHDTGTQMSSQELTDTWNRWLEGWEKSKVSSNCLTIKYEDFMEDPQCMVQTISDYLGVTLTKERFRKCISFFRPRQKRTQ